MIFGISRCPDARHLAGAALSVVVAALLAGWLTPASANASAVAISVPGEIYLLGDGGRQEYEIEESPLDQQQEGMPLAGFIVGAAPLREAGDRIAIGIETRVLPNAVGQSIGAGLLSLLAVVAMISSDSNEERDKYGSLLIHDYSPTPLIPQWPCRDVRLEYGPLPEPTPGSSTGEPVTFACPMYRSLDGISSPNLFVWTGSGGDSIDLSRMKCATCTKVRRVWADAGDDVIVGSPFADILAGDLHNDAIFGRGGSDLIWGYHEWSVAIPVGGSDSDRLFGGAGSDTILGQWDRDLISGGGFDDLAGPSIAPGIILPPGITSAALQGGPGDDTVIGGSGVDSMQGGAGRDTILAKESDFGTPNVPDAVADCAGGGEAKVPDEDYRRSPLDPIASCDFAISDLFAATLDWTEEEKRWRGGRSWPWHPEL